MKRTCIFIAVFFCFTVLFAEEAASADFDLQKSIVMRYTGSGAYWMTERSDLRRYDNGTYTGLTSREVRSFVYPSERRGVDEAVLFEGSFYVDEKTVSNFTETALSLDASIPARFYISSGGLLTPLVDKGFPTFRSFPSFPADALEPGSTWTAEAVRAVDPLNKGVYTRLPMKVLYTFKGEELYKGKRTYRVQAVWATRYGISRKDPAGDDSLVFASGSHSADIYVLQDTGAAFVIADRVDEEFRYVDGHRVRFKGNILLFTDFPPAFESAELLPVFERIVYGKTQSGAQEKKQPLADGVASGVRKTAEGVQSIESDGIKSDTVVEKTPAGLRLSLRNIGFLPDSTDFAPEELQRLDAIAVALQKADRAKFLIEGHTAFVGRSEDEKRLSAERARRIADELIKRGLSADRFITKGWGAERPTASNETEYGRAQNRRVEITVLE